MPHLTERGRGGAHREWPHVALLQALAQPLDLLVHRSLVVLVDGGGLRWEAEERGRDAALRETADEIHAGGRDPVLRAAPRVAATARAARGSGDLTR